MVQIVEFGNPKGRLAEMLGMSLGQGLGSGLNTYFANRSLESVMKDKSLEGSPPSKKLEAIRAALSPYGEKGQEIFNQRMQIEQQEQQERERSDLSKISGYYQKRQDIPSDLLSRQSVETQLKIQDRLKSRQLGENIRNTLIKNGVPEEQANYYGDMIENTEKGTNQSAVIKEALETSNRYRSQIPENNKSAMEIRANRIPRTPQEQFQADKEGLSETTKIRSDIASRAENARRAVANKKFQLHLVQKGKLDDPVTVELAKRLPGAIGNKLLSKDTLLYQSGLFDEFGVLKTMFPGQIRVKEIELLEDKLASLDKNAEAKKAILEHGIKKLEYDQVIAKAAAEVEKIYPDARLLEFDQLVSEKAQPELDKLYKELIDGYEGIYNKYGAPSKPVKSGFRRFKDKNDEIYDIPIDKVDDVLNKYKDLKEVK